ncbi:sensor histidine kinase [Fodinicola feengrottensis]|uniref:sensor histidine kinase n=1 Tax=Fodinicola feengrottensis TaxID=435914 RepID=UPI0013D0D424|nr:histidine kinase [Fodinicola feengrottensis]
MTERVAQLERERDAEAARLVNEERLRIAYEVHDVIAHSIASISVQAGVASHVIDRRPEKAKESLDAIKQTSTEALGELRSVLGALRSQDANLDERHPAASLRRLPELTRMAEAAGLHATVTVLGEPATLPAAVELAAYRIVQEALTNVVRHARTRAKWRSSSPTDPTRSASPSRTTGRDRALSAAAAAASPACESALVRSAAPLTPAGSAAVFRSRASCRWSPDEPHPGADRGRPCAGTSRFPDSGGNRGRSGTGRRGIHRSRSP